MNDKTRDIDRNDLNLVDDHLDDDVKDDNEIWQEFDEAENPGSAASAADDGAPGDDAGDDDEGADDWTAEQEGDDDTAAAAADEDEQQGNDQPDASASGEQNGNSQQNNNLWANATPEQRAAFEATQAQLKKLEQADRSNRGRLSALQLKINELTGSNTAKAAPEKGAAAKGDNENGQAGEEDANGFLGSEDWKGFKSEYPEVAGPLEKVIGQLQSHIAKQDKVLSAIGDDRRQSALDEQENLLLETHSDAFEVVQDPGFVQWLNTQPRHIREAAIRNAENIVDAEEAADVVGRFKDFRRADQQGGGNNAQQQNNSSQPANGGGGNNQNQRSVSGKRQRQLASANSARSRGPGAASGIAEDGDPEQIWKQFDAMEARQARRA